MWHEAGWESHKETHARWLYLILYLIHQLRRTTLKSLWSWVHIEWFPGLATASVTPEVSLKQQSCHIYFLKNIPWLWWLGGRAELVCSLLPTSSLLRPCVPELLIRLHLNTHSPQHCVCRQGSPLLCCLKTMSVSWGSPEFDWWAKGAGKRADRQQSNLPQISSPMLSPQPESSDITRLPRPSSYT